MTSDAPGRPPVDRLLEVLRVRRNVAVGVATGAALSAVLYATRLIEPFGPAPDRGSPLLFLGLAVVLAVSVAGLVATLLTIVTAVRVVKDGDEE